MNEAVHSSGIAKQVANSSQGLLRGIGKSLATEIGASAKDTTLEDDVEKLVDALVDKAVAKGAKRKLDRLRRA
jgi:hypothetical protein